MYIIISMIVIYIDYKGSRNIETDRFKDFDVSYLDKLSEIERNKQAIESIKIFRHVKSVIGSCSVFSLAAQETLVNTTNPELALRRARALANA